MSGIFIYQNINELTSSYSNNLDIYNGFFVLLNRIQKNKDHKGFVVSLRNLLSTPFSLNEIQEKHSEKNSNALIPLEIKNKTSILLKHLQNNPKDEVSLWALTYVFSYRDLLDDSIEYFGYIDDLEVLNTAFQLIQ